jgi:L-amino acid N-acyltransferase YncA
LLQQLIRASEGDGIWSLQAQIISDNTASISLHRKCGFREIGYRERYGQVRNVWRDVVLLERRSSVAGGPGLPTRECG